ncbi:hypothetical protein ACGFRG_08075 [Streptomyces sp. NPDC048696]|uniref:hypothetical protein n=1 Tax=Streptomyces sp. NPDC048696 TaxID=3365585 RepID=UPI00371C71E8
MDEHINPELLKRLGRVKPEPIDTPESRYRSELDPMLPASMQPGSDKLAFFWIAYFLILLLVVPVLIEWL